MLNYPTPQIGKLDVYLTVRLAVRDPGPGVGVVRVPLRIQVVQKHVNFVLG